MKIIAITGLNIGTKLQPANPVITVVTNFE